MSAPLLSHLRHTLAHLKAQSRSTFSILDKQRLQQMLAATIETFHSLYPDHLNHPQRVHLLQSMVLLEQHSVAIGPIEEAVFTTDLPTWQAARESLISSIEITLADEASTPD